jgi:hypothetical protein
VNEKIGCDRPIVTVAFSAGALAAGDCDASPLAAPPVVGVAELPVFDEHAARMNSSAISTMPPRAAMRGR